MDICHDTKSSSNWCRNIGYLLHPSVVKQMPTCPVIADIGTGTGLFLSKLAASYPGASLRGFDISSALFPPPECLPSNVTLSVMDVKQPPPEEECNRYDLVHVRLITAGMSPTDWDVAVRNLVKLLKHGAALQWEECNFLSVQHLRGMPDSTVATARFMGRLFRDALKEKFSYGWSSLPQIMVNEGLMHVDTDFLSSDRVTETREAMTRNGMAAIFGWANLMSMRNVPDSLSKAKLEELEDRAYEDIKSGCYVRFDIHTSIGFKPS